MDQGDTEDLSLSPASSQLDQVVLEGEQQGDDLCVPVVPVVDHTKFEGPLHNAHMACQTETIPYS